MGPAPFWRDRRSPLLVSVRPPSLSEHGASLVLPRRCESMNARKRRAPVEARGRAGLSSPVLAIGLCPGSVSAPGGLELGS
jgi:hypothetical protein